MVLVFLPHNSIFTFITQIVVTGKTVVPGRKVILIIVIQCIDCSHRGNLVTLVKDHTD